MSQSLVGYQLVDQSGAVVQSWGGTWGQCPGVPDVIYLPNGDQVHCPEVGVQYANWTLVQWMMDPPPPPVPTCLLWQLEATCNAPPASLGFTPPTWPQIQAIVAAFNSAAVTAFFNVGTNSIPANSKTLIALAAQSSPPLTADQVTALVQQASAVSIP
jgi:hypothetical protein